MGRTNTHHQLAPARWVSHCRDHMSPLELVECKCPGLPKTAGWDPGSAFVTRPSRGF